MARIGTLAFVFLLLTAGSSWAHSVNVECQVRGERVEVSAFYGDDTDAADAQVRVLEGDQEIATGKTDDKGLWTFPTPPPGTYRVIINAGAGHKKTVSLTIPSPVGKSDTDEPASPDSARRESTRYPWLKVGLGLGILGLLTIAFFLRPRK